ncbi:MAG: hypothetical protein PHR35_17610 [Kiritimatiellae bacterium]|nr:hypothetical protein [Kiritimatiellia bacterium]
MNRQTRSCVAAFVVAMVAAVSGLPSAAEELFKYDGYLTTTPTVIATNAALSSVTGLIASRMQGGSVTYPGLGGIYHFTNNGSVAAYQVQRVDVVHNKCVKVQMEQSGPDITARAIYAKYGTSASYPVGFDFDTGGTLGSVATSDAAYGYGINVIHVFEWNSTNWPIYMPPHMTPILGGYRLSSVSGVSAKIGGGSISDPDPVAHVYFFTNNGITASFQAQALDGGHTKCVKIEMEASGSNLIKAKAAYAKYLAGSNLGFDFDSGGSSTLIATSSSDGGYGLLNLEFAIVHKGTVITLL